MLELTTGPDRGPMEDRMWRAAEGCGRRYLEAAGLEGGVAELQLRAALVRCRSTTRPDSPAAAARAVIAELRRATGHGQAGGPQPAAQGQPVRRQPLRPIFGRRGRRRVAHRQGRFSARRLMLFTAVFGTATWSTAQFASVLATDGVSPLDGVQILVFALLALWLSQSFWSLTAGLGVLVTARLRSRVQPSPRADGERLALVVPIYNEDTARVFAGIEAIWRDLSTSPVARRIDLHVLSDTTEPALWLAEVDAFDRMRTRVQSGERLFYRRRSRNTGRKTGNIEEFLARCGRRYGYFLVLDADSLMTAAAIEHMLASMDADPRLGLLQAPPVLVRGQTPLARSLQFASALYGRAAAAGTAFWAGDEGNYWGHNAIIRTQAFVRYCGLPELPGSAPLGGQILSHDFVEAALMRRGGYKVRIAWDVEGSYEEPPATLEQFLRRDRRWCQGNLQHLRVAFASDLHPVSRLHFAIGIMSYVASPLWLLFLILAGAQAWLRDGLPAVRFSTDLGFAMLPRSMATETLVLLVFTLSLLFLPKLVALLCALCDRRQRRAFGGAGRLLLSASLETLFSALLAPVMMLFHSFYVASILLGAAVDWKPQRRTVSEDAWADLVRHFAWPTAVGIGATGLALALDPWLALWLGPVLAGLLLALPLALLSADLRIGSALAARGVLLTPSDREPEPVLSTTGELTAQAAPIDGDALLRATLLEPRRLQRHLELLQHGGEPADAAGLDLRRLLRKAALVGPEELDRRERLALLTRPELLEQVHVEIWAQGADGLEGAPLPSVDPTPPVRTAA